MRGSEEAGSCSSGMSPNAERETLVGMSTPRIVPEKEVQLKLSVLSQLILA